MSQLRVHYHLIPDGLSTIVDLEIKVDFAVSTDGAAREAEDAVVQLVSRLSMRSEEEIRRELEHSKWLGQGWAPDEPTAGERHGF